MQFVVRRYFSGFCTYEVEAGDKEQALEITKEMPLDYDEIISTLEPWEECDEIEKGRDD